MALLYNGFHSIYVWNRVIDRYNLKILCNSHRQVNIVHKEKTASPCVVTCSINALNTNIINWSLHASTKLKFSCSTKDSHRFQAMGLAWSWGWWVWINTVQRTLTWLACLSAFFYHFLPPSCFRTLFLGPSPGSPWLTVFTQAVSFALTGLAIALTEIIPQCPQTGEGSQSQIPVNSPCSSHPSWSYPVTCVIVHPMLEDLPLNTQSPPQTNMCWTNEQRHA